MRVLNRRKGIASLPVVIIFVALVAVGFFAAASLMSSQSYANYQLQTVQSLLAARQQELSGLKVAGTQQGTVQVEQTAGVSTTISKIIITFQNGQTQAFSINPITIPSGSTSAIPLQQILSNLFGGNIPSDIVGITLVTDRGVYLSGQVQVSTQQSYLCLNGGSLQGTTCVQQATLSGYYCHNGGTLQGSTCVEPALPNYSCPSGWTLQGTNCVQNATPIYNCPGGTLSGVMCVISGTPIYSCPSGGTPVKINGQYFCLVSQPATPNYYCPNGGTLQGTVCVIPATPVYSCPPGYSLDSTSHICKTSQTITIQTAPTYHPGYWTTQQVWVPGYWSTTKVWIPGYYTTQQVYHPGYYTTETYTYTTYETVQTGGYWTWEWVPYCYLVGGIRQGPVYRMCISIPQLVWVPTYTTIAVTNVVIQQVYHPGYYTTETIYHPGYWTTQQVWVPGHWSTEQVWVPGYYSCPTGYSQSGSMCIGHQTVTLTQPATISGYSCPPGWGPAAKGTECVQPAQVSRYYCPPGWTLNGTTCTQLTPATISGYGCPQGWTQSGSNCVQPAKISGYYCPNGGSLQGTTCVQQATLSGYYCPSGWAQNGTTCYQSATPGYYCPSGWTPQGAMCQQNAQQTTISGNIDSMGWVVGG